MSMEQLLFEIEKFLTLLEPHQQKMLQLCDQKTVQLREGKMKELIELSNHEAVLTREMQLLLSTRQQLLNMASGICGQVESLEEIVKPIDTKAAQSILQRIEHSKGISEKIRRESWVHWIIAQKSCQHYGELIDIIAHCGKQAPSYAEGILEDRSGSPLLDTTA